MYRKCFKRIIDFIIALIGLIIFSPILFVLIIILGFSNKGKPFFIQKRPGINEKLFNIIKFKTMNDKKDIRGNLMSDAERLTLIGRIIRKTSIDELPQLINVLKGDMSLIGPRPLLVEYLPLYNEKQKKRHQVRPGITGWAQVNGRNDIGWKDKFILDIFYVENVSFLLDLKIIFLTVKKVLFREGITSKTSVSMETFKGN